MSSEPTGFLYPFIEAEERDIFGVLADLAGSARAKMQLSRKLRQVTVEECSTELYEATADLAERFSSGGRLFTFGNGGSATDAEGTAELFRHPPRGRPLPAVSLVDDRAVLTALANDIGYELVFSRQLIAHGRKGDVVFGFSTSGDSVNVLKAFEEADTRGLLTVGFAGYDGGAMASSPHLRHCFVVRSDSVHRIQESQDALVFALWSAMQSRLATKEPT
jgi:D-sedoheptulose 7-phosphate isomerase